MGNDVRRVEKREDSFFLEEAAGIGLKKFIDSQKAEPSKAAQVLRKFFGGTLIFAGALLSIPLLPVGAIGALIGFGIEELLKKKDILSSNEVTGGAGVGFCIGCFPALLVLGGMKLYSDS